MINFSKPLTILMALLLAVSAVIFVLLFLGGNEDNSADLIPKFTNTFIIWTYILIFGAILVTGLFEVIGIISHPQKSFRTLLSLGVLVVLVLVAFILADDTPLKLVGYEGTDNVPSMLILSDVFIFTLYLIVSISIILVIYTELSRVLRK